MAKGLCAFQTRTYQDGMTERVRRALGQIDVGVTPIKRLIAAAERLKIKVEAPTHQSDCVAHIGFPKLKVAIFSKLSLEHAQAGQERELWEKHGWKLLAISQRRLARMSDEQLTEQLRMALVELGKVK